MDTIIHDGKKLTASKTFGWRPAAAGDVDADGKPVSSNYVAIVKIADCPVVEKNGRACYDPKGVAQAVKLGYGGTSYGYETKESTARTARVFTDARGNAFPVAAGRRYAKVTLYVVSNGRVYTTSWHRPVV
jgi:hypothetical protein